MRPNHRNVGFACVLVICAWAWPATAASAQSAGDEVSLSIAPGMSLENLSRLAGASAGTSFRPAANWGASRWTASGAIQLPKDQIASWFESLCATTGVLLEEQSEARTGNGETAAAAKPEEARALDLADRTVAAMLRARPSTRFTTVFAVDADSRELVRAALASFMKGADGRVEEVQDGPDAGSIRVHAAGARIASMEGLVAALTRRPSRIDAWLETDHVAVKAAARPFPAPLTVGAVAGIWGRQTGRAILFESGLEGREVPMGAAPEPAGRADGDWCDALAKAGLVVIRIPAPNPDAIVIASPATLASAWNAPVFVPQASIAAVAERRAELFLTVLALDAKRMEDAPAIFREVTAGDSVAQAQFKPTHSCVIVTARGHHLAELARRLTN
jgi:hypothetical protein